MLSLRIIICFYYDLAQKKNKRKNCTKEYNNVIDGTENICLYCKILISSLASKVEVFVTLCSRAKAEPSLENEQGSMSHFWDKIQTTFCHNARYIKTIDCLIKFVNAA